MKTIREFRDLPYADYNGRILRLDLYVPETGGALLPAILYVRGGGWTGTTKKEATFMGPILAREGFVTAVIEYRSSNEAIAPANIQDCKAALRWLRANAKTYGIDPNRIGATGGSAGGHLVALLGTTNGVKELEGSGGNAEFSSDVQAVVDFCGPTDLLWVAIPEHRKQFKVLYDVTAIYVGGPVDERRELAKLVSPLHHVSPSTVPMLIVHGEADAVVSVEESVILHDALKKAGTDVALRSLPGAGHSWDWELTRAEVVGFFRRTLADKR
jgi:acetyl esterase/lipase